MKTVNIPYRYSSGRRRGLLAAGALGMLLVAGCATTPQLYVDAADEPPACGSFAWLETPERPASIAEQRVRTEVMRVLLAKGYSEDDAAPDCRVSGAIFTGDRPGSPVSVGVGAGRWGGSFGGSVGVSMPVGGRRTVGNLAIDVIDVDQNAEVWRGTLENAFRTPEPTSGEVSEAVQRILEEFPNHTME